MEVIFWLVVLIATLAILFVTKLTHLRHRLSIILLILLCVFVYLSFLSIANNSSIEIKSASDFFSATKLYFLWLGHIFDNMRIITGNAMRMEWMPTNSTQ